MYKISRKQLHELLSAAFDEGQCGYLDLKESFLDKQILTFEKTAEIVKYPVKNDDSTLNYYKSIISQGWRQSDLRVNTTDRSVVSAGTYATAYPTNTYPATYPTNTYPVTYPPTYQSIVIDSSDRVDPVTPPTPTTYMPNGVVYNGVGVDPVTPPTPTTHMPNISVDFERDSELDRRPDVSGYTVLPASQYNMTDILGIIKGQYDPQNYINQSSARHGMGQIYTVQSYTGPSYSLE